jgi:hypothetical protein
MASVASNRASSENDSGDEAQTINAFPTSGDVGSADDQSSGHNVPNLDHAQQPDARVGSPSIAVGELAVPVDQQNLTLDPIPASAANTASMSQQPAATNTSSNATEPGVVRAEATKQPRTNQAKSSLSNWWIWELSSTLFSILCFIGIMILLAISNGRGVPQLRYGLTV